jgi:hypothetical protein
MLVLGTENGIYLLHLAMRGMAAHRFQLILKVELEADPATSIGDRSFVGTDINIRNTSANQIYFRDRSHPDNDVEVYTFRPGQSFPLAELVAGERTDFRGDFVRGHFERDPGPPDILKNVSVQVKEILFAQALQSPEAGDPHPLDAGRLDFLLFGSGDEFFISHKITLHEAPTDNAFHQVFFLQEQTAQQLNFDLTRSTALIEIDGAHAEANGRLPETGGAFPGQLKELVQGVDVPLPIELAVHPQHYLEVLM